MSTRIVAPPAIAASAPAKSPSREAARAADASLRRVILTTATLAEGQTFTLTVNNVRDRAAAANLIAPDSQISMTAYPFLLRTVGTVTASNSVVTLPGGGFDVNAAGNDIGGRGDDFGYQSQFRSGDFDVRARVSALDLADGYAKAGWMARASLDTNSPFAAVFATPSLGGCYFQSRTTA